MPSAPSLSGQKFGRPCVPAEEHPKFATYDPFEIDPQKIDRGTRAYTKLRNAFASHLQAHGFDPLSPAPGEPDFDVAWRFTYVQYVAQVKSISDVNEEQQLRLGLGQLLRVHHVLRESVKSVIPVLVTSRQPKDPLWVKLFKGQSIHLIWPETFPLITDVRYLQGER